MAELDARVTPDLALRRLAQALGGSPTERLRLTVRELTEAALGHLARVHADPVNAVHEARRKIRSARALLRLPREGLGEDLYRRESGRLRDAASLLSAHRDAHVLVEAFDRVLPRVPDAQPEPAGRVRTLLARGEEADVANHAAGAALHLRRFLDSMETWPERCDDPRIVAHALRRSVRRAKSRYRDAAADPTPARLHELRKRCKDVRDQLRMLAPLKPRKLDKLQARYDKVCEVLGEGRDARLLQDALRSIACELPDGVGLAQALAKAAGKRHAELAEKGLRKARKAVRAPGRKLRDLMLDQREPDAPELMER